MQKSMGLGKLNHQNRAQLVAHLKRVSVNREESAVRPSLEGSTMNANVEAVLKALDDVYLKK